ncbi:hypothetical protein AGMMS50262_04700 [Bacteroidia bacterium]|nr:hypothetical protein AGMMS50262_04700 [Bacteroidia bacterium]
MKLRTLLLLLPFLLATLSLHAQRLEKDSMLFSPKGIAEIRITLSNGKKIDDIKNEKNDKDYAGKLEATMRIKNSETSEYNASTDFYNGRIRIEGRGNTTWGVPKRPYNIDLVTEDGLENKAALLGMPEAEEWSLLAFWHDRSLMRIPMAMFLGQHMKGIQWTPRMRYAEVWINNEYRGLYLLSEKIQRDDNRIDIKKLTDAPEDQIEPRIAGGYILEGSTEGKLTELERSVQFKTSHDINFTFKYPKPKNVTPAQREWIKNYINEFETVLWDNDKFKDPVNGYQKYIDVASFIDWTILHEQSRGVDNFFHASTFVHKDRNGKLNMSAPWDFDLSYGNAGSPDADSRQETGNMVRRHRWFDRLSKDEAYMKKYKDRLDELTPLFNQIPVILKVNYQQLEDAEVLLRESEKWPQILWEFDGNKEAEMVTPWEYKAHVRFLSDWVMSRNAWCYMELGETNSEKSERLERTRPVIRVMDPEALEVNMSFDTKVMKGYTYVWNDSEQTNNNVKNIRTKGKYWVKIKDASGHISLASDTLYFGVTPPPPNGILPVENAQINYNNPVKEILTIHYTAGQAGTVSIQLADIKGATVKKANIDCITGIQAIQINVSDLTPGVYILRFSTENGHITKKLIKN